MTNDQTVTQADERSPAQFFFEMGFGACYAEGMIINGNRPPFPLSDAIIERQWAISQEAYDDPAELATMLARTAHSGDLAPGLERAAQWHDARCKGPDVFEQELHEVSAKALRHLAANPDATDMQSLDAAHSGEGRSNGAGEDAAPVVTDEEIEEAFRQGDCAWTVRIAIRQLFEKVRALSAPQCEVERLREALERLVKLTPASANAHTAQDLCLTVRAIAESALAQHRSTEK